MVELRRHYAQRLSELIGSLKTVWMRCRDIEDHFNMQYCSFAVELQVNSGISSVVSYAFDIWWGLGSIFALETALSILTLTRDIVRI